MQDIVGHGCRCNGQISLVICFNPLYTHNMTAGQQINTKRPPSSFSTVAASLDKTKFLSSLLRLHIKTQRCEEEE